MAHRRTRFCEKVLADFGMTIEDINAELPAFHALNVQNGTMSQDWGSTFHVSAKRWKERVARSARGSSPEFWPPYSIAFYCDFQCWKE